ncbi:Xanthine and CO dehydrogenase maturation factor, XdhC/CoxF family [Sulfobacillus thermosulfidooxidans DSM 9293]|uniref:Xanthine and CO dehydrogenase maturation factor, XdhC/CoxF family n=1 Tax=Sulfobacillus thermosulfidooxidans (strain DSM 9293 / VKM B-1269 / AT-1) TaxID=929705 RepID=A0A1W1WG33_SULTA|nr:XdhC/CoxI family protein [Sulfobacillus thermosulfidooxidans]SMC05010.1 Xanthine and CO dehydrogenase maturation factor, XdhC/CoxF family [Sulfobacillus thermosulfidooxidans DSM 9293]
MSSIREAQKIFEAIFRAENEGHRSCLLMITTVQGSAYRRPGAKMMMADDGRMVGTLSGGCLEGDLYHYAEKVMKTQVPTMHHYNLVEDEMWGLGIGCKGEIDVLIEPIWVNSSFWLEFFQAINQEEPLLLGLQLPQGERFYHSASGEKASSLSSQSKTWVPEFSYSARTIVKDGVLLDYLMPPPKLIVAGAGHDAKPVVELAKRVGFDVYILDRRALFNNAREFPWASEWIVDESGLSNRRELYGAYWLIMNHHQARDEAALFQAMQSYPRYIGVLGPLARTQDMLKNIQKTHVEDLPIFAPVGLDLGAETPEEVAISIVSELLMIRQQTLGGHLNGRDRIHLPPGNTNASTHPLAQ